MMALDLDDPNEPNFPNDAVNNGPEIANNVITVGALTSKYGSEMVADFSNYGDINVDVFAPGAKIYSTLPNNKYDYHGWYFNGGACCCRGCSFNSLTIPQVKCFTSKEDYNAIRLANKSKNDSRRGN